MKILRGKILGCKRLVGMSLLNRVNFTDEKYLPRKENKNDCRDSYVQNEGSSELQVNRRYFWK